MNRTTPLPAAHLRCVSFCFSLQIVSEHIPAVFSIRFHVGLNSVMFQLCMSDMLSADCKSSLCMWAALPDFIFSPHLFCFKRPVCSTVLKVETAETWFSGQLITSLRTNRFMMLWCLQSFEFQKSSFHNKMYFRDVLEMGLLFSLYCEADVVNSRGSNVSLYFLKLQNGSLLDQEAWRTCGCSDCCHWNGFRWPKQHGSLWDHTHVLPLDPFTSVLHGHEPHQQQHNVPLQPHNNPPPPPIPCEPTKASLHSPALFPQQNDVLMMVKVPYSLCFFLRAPHVNVYQMKLSPLQWK